MKVSENLKDLIDNSPMSRYQIIVVALCFILNMNDGIDVLVVSFTGSEMMKEWVLSKSQLGSIFSAGLIGMTMGCFLIAPLGDKVGRRRIFLYSVLLITIGILSIYFTTAYWQVLICRVTTGLGIGGILPTMASTAAEFSNKKSRDFNVGLIQGGWPLGAVLTSFFAAWAVPIYGWRYIYLIAGLVSLSMWIAVYFFMPDSLSFLSDKQPTNAKNKINKALKKMGHPVIDELSVKSNDSKSIPIKELFFPEYRSSTIRLWIGIFFGFLTLYTLMSWVPTIAKDAGMPFALSVYAGTALNLGAFIGVIAMGLLVSRYGVKRVILSFMLIAFGIMMIYSRGHLSTYMMFILIFLIGFFVQGGFNAFFPAATSIYPSIMRATGVGLAFGIGRVGAILGPQLFGIFSDAGLSIATLFTLFSIPLIVAGIMAFSIPSKNIK